MTLPNSQTILAGMALGIMGTLGMLLVFYAVPPTNHELVVYVLGAVSGALTVGGASKIADKITASSGPDATIQSDPPATPGAPQ